MMIGRFLGYSMDLFCVAFLMQCHHAINGESTGSVPSSQQGSKSISMLSNQPPGRSVLFKSIVALVATTSTIPLCVLHQLSPICHTATQLTGVYEIIRSWWKSPTRLIKIKDITDACIWRSPPDFGSGIRRLCGSAENVSYFRPNSNHKPGLSTS